MNDNKAINNNNTKMDEATPLEFYLSQNYPNPFKENTTIKYCIACKTRVQLKVFDQLGNVVANIVDEEKSPGTYEIVFDVAQDSNPAKSNCVSSESGYYSGVYFYRLEAGDFICEKKMEIKK